MAAGATSGNEAEPVGGVRQEPATLPAGDGTPVQTARRSSFMASDEDGVIHVFEAIITGVIVLTAILFMTALSGPSSSEGATSIDLGRIAGDTLAILQARPAEDPASYDSRLEEIVDNAMQGGDTTQDQAFLREVLPPGTRYLLRLDNGIEAITLMPTTTGPTTNPRGAQAAEVFLAPAWQAFADQTVSAEFVLGEQYTPCGVTLKAPTGVSSAPGGDWATHFSTLPAGHEGHSHDHIPAYAPYGVWECGTTYLRISPPDGTDIDYGLYAVQLVVWPGA